MGEVDAYVDGLHEPERGVVAGLYARAAALVPGTEQGREDGAAVLRYRGRPLVAVRVGSAGCTVQPFSADVTALVGARLPGFAATTGGIRFTVDRLLPEEAFDALVTGRRSEIDVTLLREARAGDPV